MTFGKDLESDLDLFLQAIRDEWEFGGAVTAKELLDGRGKIESHQVARAMIAADGMNPDREPSWTRRIKRAFAQRYHDHAITAQEYLDFFTR